MRTWLVVFLSSITIASGQFSFVYSDSAGTGFFSTEARAPVGGNSGTTLGEQRQLALEKAASIWSEYLVIEGPVEILAGFDVQTAGALAGARALDVTRNFPGAPESDTWYPSALANHLTKIDQFPGNSEIEVIVNSSYDDSPPGFYYGLDGAGGLTDFVRVLVHELGHGLGMFSLADANTGQLALGTPTIYTKKLFDLELKKTWDQLTDGERVESSTRGTLLRWNGSTTPLATSSEVSGGLALASIDILVGGLITETYPATLATFGPNFPLNGLSDEIVLALDGTPPNSDLCEPITNGPALNGNIALVDRGTCLFTTKVIAAEAAGATAVIIANNIPNSVITMTGTAPFPSIPSTLVTQATGVALRNLPVGAQVVIRPEAQAGLYQKQPLLYNPLIFEPGSSISHFDINTTPNLLMEPIIGINREDPDLALTVMRDLGWKVRDLPFPNLNYATWENLRVTGPKGQDTDGDSDGFDNFSEYAFASDPNDGLSIPANSTLEINSLGEAKLHFTRSDQATDLSFRILDSETAQEFGETPTTIENINEAGPERSKESRNLGTPSGRKFYRVEALEQ